MIINNYLLNTHRKKTQSKYLQLLDKILEGTLLNLLLHNFHHFLSDELLVRCLGVASSLDLLLGLVGEGNAEH